MTIAACAIFSQSHLWDNVFVNSKQRKLILPSCIQFHFESVTFLSAWIKVDQVATVKLLEYST